MNLKDTLQKHNFKFKKKFGQNFITDGNLLQKIVDAGEVGPDDVIIEVGPGAATLTKALARQAKAVISIEIDGDLIPIIEETMAEFDNFYLVQGDALRLNLDALIVEKTRRAPSLQGNRQSALLHHHAAGYALLEQGFSIDRIVIMVQKKWLNGLPLSPAQKITAQSPYRSSITALCATPFWCPGKCLSPSPM